MTNQKVLPAARWAPVALAAALAACGGGNDDPPVQVGVYSIGGGVSGLATGGTVVLQNNGADDLSVSANGDFVFATSLSSGVAYAVTVKTQPAGQRCAVAQGSGTATAKVSNVQVRCEALAAATYTVGGAVSGLAGGSLVLQNNGGNDLTVASNGGFTFASALAGGTAYAVTVKTPPAGQSCTVRNGTGTVATANVGNVEVNCATAALTLPEGDWAQEQCSVVRAGQWGRIMWRITRQGDMRVAGRMGAVTYGNASCSGTGTVVSEQLSDMGTLSFERSGSTASTTAFWGAWASPQGLNTRAIWARKGPYLCMLSDSSPSVLPAAADVERYIDLIIPNKACYVKL